MRVFVRDIIEKRDNNGFQYSWIICQLKSGLSIIVHNDFYDLKRYKGQEIEMLLSVLRSPYLERERGIHNQVFSPEDYYSMELIDEIRDNQGCNKQKDDRKRVILTGLYINCYDVPMKWFSSIIAESRYLKSLLENPAALKTKDGIFLLNPYHLEKRIPLEKFPKEVTLATGRIDLVGWHPISVSTFTSLES